MIGLAVSCKITHYTVAALRQHNSFLHTDQHVPPEVLQHPLQHSLVTYVCKDAEAATHKANITLVSLGNFPGEFIRYKIQAQLIISLFSALVQNVKNQKEAHMEDDPQFETNDMNVDCSKCSMN